MKLLRDYQQTLGSNLLICSTISKFSNRHISTRRWISGDIKVNFEVKLNFFVSLVEQDLGFRSNLFLGTAQSEWAKMITVDRQASSTQNKIECSIMEYLVNAKCMPVMQNDFTEELVTPKLSTKL